MSRSGLRFTSIPFHTLWFSRFFSLQKRATKRGSQFLSGTRLGRCRVCRRSLEVTRRRCPPSSITAYSTWPLRCYLCGHCAGGAWSTFSCNIDWAKAYDNDLIRSGLPTPPSPFFLSRERTCRILYHVKVLSIFPKIHPKRHVRQTR